MGLDFHLQVVKSFLYLMMVCRTSDKARLTLYFQSDLHIRLKQLILMVAEVAEESRVASRLYVPAEGAWRCQARESDEIKAGSVDQTKGITVKSCMPFTVPNFRLLITLPKPHLKRFATIMNSLILPT